MHFPVGQAGYQRRYQFLFERPDNFSVGKAVKILLTTRQIRACKRSRLRPAARRGRTTCIAAGATRIRSESDLPNADRAAGAMETDAHSQAAVVRWCKRSPDYARLDHQIAARRYHKAEPVRSRGKGYEYPVGRQRHKSYARLLFPCAQQMQIRQIRPGQTGVEFARLQHHQIKDVLYACLVAIGIREDARAALWHLLPPCSPSQVQTIEHYRGRTSNSRSWNEWPRQDYAKSAISVTKPPADGIGTITSCRRAAAPDSHMARVMLRVGHRNTVVEVLLVPGHGRQLRRPSEKVRPNFLHQRHIVS